MTATTEPPRRRASARANTRARNDGSVPSTPTTTRAVIGSQARHLLTEPLPLLPTLGVVADDGDDADDGACRTDQRDGERDRQPPPIAMQRRHLEHLAGV